MAAKVDNILINTDKRMFYLSDDVDNLSIGRLCFNLLYILNDDDEKEAREVGYVRKPINIYINSYGGDVYDMWGLIDIINSSKTPIYTYCTGYAMSAAFMIFISGHKRFVYPHSTLMYHQFYAWRHGKYQDMVEDRAELDILNKQHENYTIEKTGLTREEIDMFREKKQDIYFHGEEAVWKGIADEVR